MVRDEVVGTTSVRRYVPTDLRFGPPVIFLHGGYGIFGDLDLQDGWCRRLAGSWGCRLVPVDYPLAPEHSLHESVQAVMRARTDAGMVAPILCGDSAGAALALAAATEHRGAFSGLVLTNPNIDLTLSRFDHDALEGPNLVLSHRAFARWTHGWTHAADFTTVASLLPPTFIAVGRRDALLRESRALNDALRSAGQRHEIAEYDAGHGLLGQAVLSDDLLSRARAFFQG